MKTVWFAVLGLLLPVYAGLWLARVMCLGKKYVQVSARKPLWIRAQGYSRHGVYWKEKYQRSFFVHKRIDHNIFIPHGSSWPALRMVERYHVCVARSPWWLPFPPRALFMNQESVQRVWEEIGERAMKRLDKPPAESIDYPVF